MLPKLFTSVFFFPLVLGGVSTPPPTQELVRRALTPPSEDPFYQAPAGYENASPGDILASRKAPAKLAAFQTIPLTVKEVWQVSYRSTDALGNPQASVSTIIIPYNADFSKVVSYQIAEDAAYINCAPSYVLQTGSNTAYAGTGSIEVLLMAGALKQGWVVSTPDWEGPQSSFIEGFQAAYSTLDSIRAALKSTTFTGVKPSADVQMWGYSGGALASEWAAELQASYAPELNIIGMAIGGTTPNVQNVYNTINNGLFAGLSFAALGSLTKIFPDFKNAIDAQLVPGKANDFYASLERCFYDDVVSYAFQNTSTYFKTDIVKDPIVARYLNDHCNQGFHGVPSMPVFWYKAQNDEISPIADSDALVQKYCNAGVSITYVREAAGEHFTEAALSIGDVLNFLKARFNGVPISGCTTRSVFLSPLSDPATATTAGLFIISTLLAIIGVPIGPNHF
ncbi:secretory lipase-domain-containing protein [Microdochium trichocladiopsis]|uniref:Secretory lipase-domain-containing protein n=1 Tax=Microdochium trichocladiopsis TaxID=1682393 RepID=A0A9P8XRS9_9PEZI|nr:secretory lipase-domain-containing protein [Microdochium trichocladiopsis]KAH7014081.1 secretory lipase-domain-containing protein [Microdochium trichocladiopsis]